MTRPIIADDKPVGVELKEGKTCSPSALTGQIEVIA
jgi:hypothetical protein